jgi:hypothetical protein
MSGLRTIIAQAIRTKPHETWARIRKGRCPLCRCDRGGMDDPRVQINAMRVERDSDQSHRPDGVPVSFQRLRQSEARACSGISQSTCLQRGLDVQSYASQTLGRPFALPLKGMGCWGSPTYHWARHRALLAISAPMSLRWNPWRNVAAHRPDYFQSECNKRCSQSIPSWKK